LKILILTPDIYTHGGIARYTWTLASVLGSILGPDNVYVLSLLHTGKSYKPATKFYALDVVNRKLTAAHKGRFAARALYYAKRRYDLVICTHLGLCPVGALIRAFFGTPFWVTCHGIEAWRPLPVDEKIALKWADRVVPISCFTARKMANVNHIPAQRITVLYNAVPDEFVALLTSQNEASVLRPRPQGQKRLLSVGMLSKALAYKGFDTIIQALPKVLKAVPNLHYTVVGEGDNKQELRRLSVECGVEECVEFTGEISDAELAEQYRACDVFVLPSRFRERDGDFQGEGFDRVYLEAALAGKPVVGSSEGGAAEAVVHGKTGVLVNPSSVSDVAAALIELLRNSEVAERMGLEGQRWANENFTENALRSKLREMLAGPIGAHQQEVVACAEYSE
jgi:phosphatidyl-myo-inositol dimannoside synthase